MDKRNNRSRFTKAFSKPVLLFLLALCTAFCVTGCGGRAHSSGPKLKVGVHTDVTGFGYYKENAGRFYGMEVDLGEALAERLGYYGAEFVAVDASDREEKLASGEVDCLLAMLTIDESRKERMLISEPYYTSATVVLVENSSLIATMSDLSSMKVGVSGSTNERILTDAMTKAGQPVPEFVVVPRFITLSDMLEEGEIDAICLDETISYTYLQADRSVLRGDLALQEYGLAARKGDALGERIVDELNRMITDGTVQEYADKWVSQL